MLNIRTLRAVLALVVVALAVVVVVSPASSARKAAPTIVIWADKDRVPAVTKIANLYAQQKGVEVSVVQKEMGPIREDLKTVQANTAPDVILGAHDWVGEVAANGSVVPLFPSKATLKNFPAYSIDAFSYGTGSGAKKLFGAPVALENIALITNTKLAKVPTSFGDLEKQALAVKKKTGAPVGLSVQQGANGDPYHMYPLFSGLCGYIFGNTASGNLDPTNVGVANPKFLKNAPLIDRWNKEGLIRSSVDASISKDLFLKGQTAYFYSGPWNLSDIRKTPGLTVKITPFPAIPGTGCKSVPFLGVQGFMVTKFAATHGVDAIAKDFVANFMMQPDAQTALAAANDRFPANTTAAAKVADKDIKAFGAASVGGVPMPNIPQMAPVWGDLGAAWVRSTKGAGALNARRSFIGASKAITLKIKAAG
jgi:arabinogalactan oligomer / maltooligosaccharide transport system substrate-binding protein